MAKKKKPDLLLLCTTDVPAGYNVKRVLGMAWGSEVKSKGSSGSLVAFLRGFKGGVVPELQNMAMEARRTSVDRMIKAAEKLGANGIMGVRLEGFTFRNNTVEFVAYGTAVIVEKA